MWDDYKNLDSWLEKETGAKKGTSEHTAAKIAIKRLLEDAAKYIKAEKKEAALDNAHYGQTSVFGIAVNWTFGAIVEPITGTDPEEIDEL